MGNLFSTRFLVTLMGIFLVSSALSYALMSTEKKQASNNAMSLTSGQPPLTNEPSTDELIDQALEFSVNGHYQRSFPILKQLADQDVIRAKLYLAVAYYHGQGTPRNRQKAKELFMELLEKEYELGIVNTYLSLIGFTEIQ